MRNNFWLVDFNKLSVLSIMFYCTIVLFSRRDKDISIGFAITFKIISHLKKILLYDSWYVEQQKCSQKEQQEVFHKKVFLKISQYSQANTCIRHQHRCFPADIAKFLKTHILKNIGELLLLHSIFVSPKQTNVEFRNCLKLVSESLMYRNLGGLKDIVSYRQQKFWMRAMVFLVL